MMGAGREAFKPSIVAIRFGQTRQRPWQDGTVRRGTVFEWPSGAGLVVSMTVVLEVGLRNQECSMLVASAKGGLVSDPV
jgi:hypothetical protein